MISLVYLGRVEYREALGLQERLVQLRKEERLPDTLLLLEHPPVLTLGRNSRREHILADDHTLERRGVRIVETNRGGDVTYHGPGQLVGYPIFDLRGCVPRLGAVEYVRKLEEVLIRTCADFGILTERIAGRTGVWTMPGGKVPEKKIAAIGVHISRAVTSHGFALNVTSDLKDFEWIVPCGIADRGVTSIEEEIDTQTHALPSMLEVSNSIARHFGRVFVQPVLWLDSLEELGRDPVPPLRSEA
ncbi:MAG TPA: lipoyl(octanoyl) transferase LipB [Acidobacteriaceae bacterium]|nr:lipoyl(octanoyl) transferase LipB [Acidobacteriaceae bacterium]